MPTTPAQFPDASGALPPHIARHTRGLVSLELFAILISFMTGSPLEDTAPALSRANKTLGYAAVGLAGLRLALPGGSSP